jgi:hypothetical protein
MTGYCCTGIVPNSDGLNLPGERGSDVGIAIFRIESSRGALMLAGTGIRKAAKRIALGLSALLLSACGDNQMAYLYGDPRSQSLSVVREQSYLGGPWQTTLVVANVATCQRRYPLEGLAANELRMDIYRPERGVFILKTGNRWYVTELQNCRFQAYKVPPPEPGELVGDFQVQDGKLRYLDRTSAKPAARTAAQAPAAAK